MCFITTMFIIFLCFEIFYLFFLEMNYNKSSYVFSYFGLANQLILDVNKDIIIECIDLMCKK